MGCVNVRVERGVQVVIRDDVVSGTVSMSRVAMSARAGSGPPGRIRDCCEKYWTF